MNPEKQELWQNVQATQSKQNIRFFQEVFDLFHCFHLYSMLFLKVFLLNLLRSQLKLNTTFQLLHIFSFDQNQITGNKVLWTLLLAFLFCFNGFITSIQYSILIVLLLLFFIDNFMWIYILYYSILFNYHAFFPTLR